VRTAPAVAVEDHIHGVELYGIGSLLLDRLWTDEAS
jgi:hypothetical protein